MIAASVVAEDYIALQVYGSLWQQWAPSLAVV